MAQNSTKGLQAKSGSGGRKKGGVVKKGARAIPPKRLEHVVHRNQMKKLSSSINNSIERQMVQAASAGKLTIMKHSGEVAATEGKGKGKGKAAPAKK